MQTGGWLYLTAFLIRVNSAEWSDAACSNGVASHDFQVCCPAKCVVCGGPRCGQRGSGAVWGEHCCRGQVIKEAKQCSTSHAPCLISARWRMMLTKGRKQRVEKERMRNDGGRSTKKLVSDEMRALLTSLVSESHADRATSYGADEVENLNDLEVSQAVKLELISRASAPTSIISTALTFELSYCL